MTGPKLNEANRVAGTKSGSKASAKYVRSSASKARVVLNLVRNQDVRTADEILQFTDREMARVVRKVLASAVANATTNDELDADELFVKACFADEGPTLKRFRPRAKGRAGKINKRTCHITVIVDRMSDEQLAVREAKTMAKGVPTSNRRARVAASRKAAAPADEAPVAEAPAEDTTPTEEAGN
jgi:large subunit ribosomal protein L22